MKTTKIFAAYLPQYHEIEENNMFWGKGFTDWVGVKKSKPQFDGHEQPKVPLNNNYYDLSDWKTIQWQAELAKKYGVDGFCIYHYWFKDSHKVLEKPAENILIHKEININYFFSWDNNSWIRSWSNIAGNAWAPNFDSSRQGNESAVLLECDYGDEEEWKRHFYYLLPFFKDERYFKIEGKPLFQFFSDRIPDKLKKMGMLWDQMAKENGFNGICLMVQKAPFIDKHIFKNQFIYQPLGIWNRKRAIMRRIKKLFNLPNNKEKLTKINYDRAWRRIIRQSQKYAKKDIYFSGIVRYDDSPRRGKRANIFIGNTPQKFERWFEIFYRINCENDKEFLLLTAWNEWGEGAYLEPDEKDGYGYLNAIKSVVIKNKHNSEE